MPYTAHGVGITLLIALVFSAANALAHEPESLSSGKSARAHEPADVAHEPASEPADVLSATDEPAIGSTDVPGTLSSADGLSEIVRGTKIYFNEVTGLAQLDNPEYVIEDQVRNAFQRDPSTVLHHIWIPKVGQTDGKPYYYNQRTYSSQWEKPADVSWEPVEVFVNEL